MNAENNISERTKREIKHRLANHRGNVFNNRIDKATQAYFIMPGHSLADMRRTLKETGIVKTDLYKKQRKLYLNEGPNRTEQGLFERCTRNRDLKKPLKKQA